MTCAPTAPLPRAREDTLRTRVERALFSAGCMLHRLRGALDAPFPVEPRGTLVWGHRGARDHAPENTLPALGLALGCGASGVEFDVHLSLERVPVVVHDDTVERTHSGEGRVAALSVGALADLSPRGAMRADVLERQHPRFRGAHPGIPTLAEALARMPEGTHVNVELKGPTPRSAGLEARVLDVLAPHRERLSFIVSSFHPAQLAECRRRDPTLPLGVLVEGRQNLLLRSGMALAWLRPAAFHPPSAIVDRALVARARAAQLRVHVWGVRGPADALRLRALGVDAVIVDDVPGVVAAFAARGV